MNTNQKNLVQYKKLGGVAYITLNRPHVLNAMNIDMHKELAEIWNDFETDDGICVGVLAGAGEKAFCVGQDLKELVKINSGEKATRSSFGSCGRPGWPRLTERFDRVKPLIAKIRGYALGGGFELALACDIIVAAEDAKFALPEVKLGLIAGAGGVFRLARQIPLRSALGYLMTGRTMTAQSALQFGLVNDVVPIEKLDACVDSWVQDLLRSAPLSIRAIKEVVAKSASVSMEQAFNASYQWEEIRKASLDALEGPRAFIEKRPPVWLGR